MLTKKRSIKYASSTTFIATPVRILAILQLCFAFALILSRLSYPFMGELFTFKSNKVLFQYVMGVPMTANELVEKTAANDRAKYFSELPRAEQAEIIHRFQQLQSETESTFFSKLIRSIHILVIELPLFERAWLVLSVAISILLLLKRPGAIYATWLLPVVALAYGLNNFWGGVNPGPAPDALLFPTEEIIVSKYLTEPLSADIEKQRLQLMAGWKQYLIKNWAGESPSADAAVFATQEKRGEFAFNLARLQAIIKNPQQTSQPFVQKEPLIILISYFFWNLFFALYANYKLET